MFPTSWPSHRCFMCWSNSPLLTLRAIACEPTVIDNTRLGLVLPLTQLHENSATSANKEKWEGKTHGRKWSRCLCVGPWWEWASVAASCQMELLSHSFTLHLNTNRLIVFFSLSVWCLAPFHGLESEFCRWTLNFEFDDPRPAESSEVKPAPEMGTEWSSFCPDPHQRLL